MKDASLPKFDGESHIYLLQRTSSSMMTGVFFFYISQFSPLVFLGLPGQPQNVKLYVTSDSSLCVRFDTPEGSNGAVVTRYKGRKYL